jgi:hypothetical protein
LLKIIRRIFSFSDWHQTHPGQPPPGDMLDAQFDEIIDRVDEWETRVRRAITEDGRIAYGAIDNTSVIPQIADAVFHDANLRIHDQVKAVDRAEKAARLARDAAEAALIRAEQLQAQARTLTAMLEPAQVEAVAAIQKAITTAEQLLAEARQAASQWSNDQNRADEANNNALLWAEVSQDWAEYMPDTIPPNTLAWMGISGEHWSARWWANRADNAFGRLTDLYLGAHPNPPGQNLEGGPIQPGSIYFDTDNNQMYVWDGAAWQPLWAPQRSLMATLLYVASAGQTQVALTTPDVDGESYSLDPSVPEAVDVHVNGLRVAPIGSGGIGGYTVTIGTSTINLTAPLNAGDKVLVDILMPESRAANGMVEVWSLKPLVFNGTQTTFTLETRQPGETVNVQKSEELVVSLDGVVQEPGVDFNASTSQIVFAQAPAADVKHFLTWFHSAGADEDLTLDWSAITGKPATFPPTLPIAQSGVTNLETDLSLKAPKASPALTGTPTAPTAAPATNTTQIATTAFVTSGLGTVTPPAASNAVPLVNGSASAGISTLYSRGDHIHPTDGSRAAAVHSHAQSDITGLTVALSNKLDASAYTAADVLTKVKTVDGIGSGLDADLLDGQDSAYFATKASVDVIDVGVF